MPEGRRFYGIVIRVYDRDHPPDHFHAIYGNDEAQIDIVSGAIIRETIPRTAYAVVNAWRETHVQELEDNLSRARQQMPILPIAPLE